MANQPDFAVKNRNDVLYAIRRTHDGIKRDVARESGNIAHLFSAQAQSAARGSSRQASAASASIVVRKGLVPKVAVGGSRRITASGRPVRAGDLFGGSEWGADLSPQFGRPWRKRGDWFFGTLRTKGVDYARMWIEAVDRSISRNWRN